MSEGELIDLRAWVAAGSADLALHRRRQITHILIWAIANSPDLGKRLYLKGGALMALAFASPRQTADVDFTALDDGALEQVSEHLKTVLAAALDRAPALLGYPDLVCRIQRWRHKPRESQFADANAPAIEATLGSARRSTGEMKRLDDGQAIVSLPLDISFREPMVSTMELGLLDTSGHIRTYDHVEVIAEKLRALLQQVSERRRHVHQRRQDVYDIAYLIEAFPPEAAVRRRLYDALIIKCGARNFIPGHDAFEDPELRLRAQDGWETLKTEVGELPPFAERFSLVQSLYRSLPWT